MRVWVVELQAVFFEGLKTSHTWRSGHVPLRAAFGRIVAGAEFVAVGVMAKPLSRWIHSRTHREDATAVSTGGDSGSAGAGTGADGGVGRNEAEDTSDFFLGGRTIPGGALLQVACHQISMSGAQTLE